MLHVQFGQLKLLAQLKVHENLPFSANEKMVETGINDPSVAISRIFSDAAYVPSREPRKKTVMTMMLTQAFSPSPLPVNHTRLRVILGTFCM